MGEIPPNMKKYAAEFIGTFMLIFTVGLVADVGNQGQVISIACVLMVMIYSFASISGANFNPAVSVALWLQGALPLQDLLAYIGAQCAGGVVAGLTIALFFKIDPAIKVGPAIHFSLSAYLVEYMYTWMLCFVVLNVALARRGNQYFGLAIGFVICAGGYGGGSVSGGCFNPAVALGCFFMNMNLEGLAALGFYAIFEILGGVGAVISFHIVRPETKEQAKEAYSLPAAKKVAEAIQKVEAYLPKLGTSEFIGTYILMLTVGLNSLCKSQNSLWSIASALMCMIFSLADVSGAQFNPAVTLAIVGVGKLSMKTAIEYVAAQVAGAAAAGLTYTLIYMAQFNGFVNAMGHVQIHPGDGFSIPQAMICEMMATFTLAYVVLSVACVEKSICSEYIAFVIGACIIAGGGAIGPVSGGSLNPAVTVGAAFFDAVAFLYTFSPWGYVLAELAGGALAAALFKFVTHPEECGAVAREPMTEKLLSA